MSRLLGSACVLLASALFAPAPASAQQSDSARRVERVRRRLDSPDSTRVRILRLRDGSTLVGRALGVDSATVHFATSVGTVMVPIAEIQEVQAVDGRDKRTGEYWFANPNATRLLFAPTGRMLLEGDGYFSTYQLLFPGFAYGLNDAVSIGGGMSIAPGAGLTEQLFYFTPKVGLVSSPRVNVAAGALVASAGLGSVEGDAFGVLYAVGTLGGRNASVTGGIGYGYVGTDLARSPIVMLGAEARASRRIALVTENYLFPRSRDDPLPVISYGIRFMGEKLAVDLAFVHVFDEDPGFPGFPWVGFVFNF